MSNIDPARIAAFQALSQIWQNGGTIDERRFQDLQNAHRARALRLSREVLRHEAGFDRVIKDYADRKPGANIRAVLHLAMFELLIDGAAAHGVLNDWVEFAKSDAQMVRASGFVNAVLRKVNELRPKLIPTNQFGKPLRKHLMGQYSSSVLDQINKLQSHYPPTDLRLKLGEDLQKWADILDAKIIKGTRSLRLNASAKISELEGFQSGKWWVQDVAASVAVDALGHVRGLKVLDLCAAPGGKTMQLADAGAGVTAVEISASRAKRIRMNLERTGLDARLVIEDALKFNEGGFDAVLLDAPCSATGTIRRHPDLRFDDPLGRMRALEPLQSQLIAHAFSLLKPGGVLVYCTCSLLQEEGEMQIERLFDALQGAAHQDSSDENSVVPISGIDVASLEVETPFAALLETSSAARPDQGLRILPNMLSSYDGCDGFYIAKLLKLS